MFDKILFPTDFSDASKGALHYAISIARHFHATLYLLHVIDNTVDYAFAYTGPFPYQVPLRDYYSDVRKRSEEMLQTLVEQEIDLTTKTVRLVTVGSPHREIVTIARQEGIQLIVIGTHGRTGLGHALLGSTAEKVVRTAPCPVLTVGARSSIPAES